MLPALSPTKINLDQPSNFHILQQLISGIGDGQIPRHQHIPDMPNFATTTGYCAQAAKGSVSKHIATY